ncbi:hypothetical protein DFH07DRAFT_1068090 [Mycena maculata]|uniref:Uncharacterized protein n=1 Tax=Mycena maculata TaxID=230809 RepID=A0AAD7HDA9_9AGAR|nr:hypothetical protein DFH07DRAFT_1068090 [Mycena maculata]
MAWIAALQTLELDRSTGLSEAFTVFRDARRLTELSFYLDPEPREDLPVAIVHRSLETLVVDGGGLVHLPRMAPPAIPRLPLPVVRLARPPRVIGHGHVGVAGGRVHAACLEDVLSTSPSCPVALATDDVVKQLICQTPRTRLQFIDVGTTDGLIADMADSRVRVEQMEKPRPRLLSKSYLSAGGGRGASGRLESVACVGGRIS